MSFQEFFANNSWWGKVLGALFGYLSAGPVGAFIGVLIGNFFDKGLANFFSNPHLLYHVERQKEVQKVFFEATFAIMGHIAKADGHVSSQEIEMAKLLMTEMKLNKSQKKLAKQLFTEGKQNTFKLDQSLSKIQRVCRNNRELLKLFIDIQYRAAQVDGLSSRKIAVLDAIFTHLGFAPLNQQYRFYDDFNFYTQHRDQKQSNTHSSQQQSNANYRQSAHFSLAHAYTLLELNANATKQEAKKAYRRLLSKNHPDRLIAQGLPESMIKIANEKTYKIRQAYELICQSKGW